MDTPKILSKEEIAEGLKTLPGWKKVLFELQRFDIGCKVTDRDLFMAGEIEKHYNSLNG